MCKATHPLITAQAGLRVHMRCPACREIFEGGKDCCYCPELLRRSRRDRVPEQIDDSRKSAPVKALRPVTKC